MTQAQLHGQILLIKTLACWIWAPTIDNGQMQCLTNIYWLNFGFWFNHCYLCLYFWVYQFMVLFVSISIMLKIQKFAVMQSWHYHFKVTLDGIYLLFLVYIFYLSSAWLPKCFYFKSNLKIKIAMITLNILSWCFDSHKYVLASKVSLGIKRNVQVFHTV